ncbi:hypothetical protein FOZ62_001467 [Perkinsus olseni]|uniref:Uncharacterized protein n=1 Tax=Perkinsus olseni TaxID=32597 RepID=A0A7J6NMF1_PEROL|nr:hypothetical protein FOZ62_001467 [Perkinsus olseni]
MGGYENCKVDEWRQANIHYSKTAEGHAGSTAYRLTYPEPPSSPQSDASGYRFDVPLAGDYRFDKLEPVALSDLSQRGPPGGGVVATFVSHEPYWKAVLTEVHNSSARPQFEVALERKKLWRLKNVTVLSTTDGIMKLNTRDFWEKAEAFFFELPIERAAPTYAIMVTLNGKKIMLFDTNTPTYPTGNTRLSAAASATKPLQYPVADPPPYDQHELPPANISRAHAPEGLPPTHEQGLSPMKQSRGLKRSSSQELTDESKKRRI